MRQRISSIVVLLILLSAGYHSAQAQGLGTLSLRATRTAILADGKQTTDLIATVRDRRGSAVNGATVRFQTTMGTLSEQEVNVFAGVARVRLTSSTVAGIAVVSAFSANNGNDSISINFTDDPQDLFEGNTYVQVTGSSYLSYTATDKVIEAQGKNGGAKLSYRNFEIIADRLQFRLEDSILRAHNNITLKRGKSVVHATRLYYSLQSNQGYALAEIDGKLQPVTIEGEKLHVLKSPTPIPDSYIIFPPLTNKLVITARSITYFPGDKLQFRRPRIYQNGQQIMSLPFYEFRLESSELFSDQFISVGTNGFGLELPVYYDLSPKSQGIIFLRHQQQIGRSYYSTNPGWSLDALQSYSIIGKQRAEGSFGFTGLTRGDWGLRWNHNQEFNQNTQGSIYIDFPQHQSVVTSMNFSQQAKQIRWGLNLSGAQTLSGVFEQNQQADIYVDTLPKPIGKSKTWLYSAGTDLNMTSGRSELLPADSLSQTTEKVNLRAFTRPLTLNPNTQLTSSFTIGQIWGSNNASGSLAMATLALTHQFSGNGGLTLTYDFVDQPSSLYLTTGKHRMSVVLNSNPQKKFYVNFNATSYLDTLDTSVNSDMIYRLDKNWRLISGLTWLKYSDLGFTDLQFTLGRRLGAREFQLTYSTYLQRISFDFTASSF